MSYVQTVLGRVKPTELGVTLPHEHILCDWTLSRSNRDRVEKPPWGTYMCFDEPEVMIDELRAFREAGGGAAVDVTCHGWGRDPVGLTRLSRESGVHLVACAGFYTEDCMPDWVDHKTVDELADWIVREVQVGCNARLSTEVTDVKAGIIKTSVSRPYYGGLELKGLRAVAKAQLATGAPITTHNSGSVRFELEGGNIGLELLEYLEADGVDPEAVIVGHTDENVDLRNLVKIVSKGAYVQFDTIGKQDYILDETRADLVVKLISRGFIDHVLLSQDRNRKPLLTKYGGPGYMDIIDRFVPILKAKGVTEPQVEQILVKNPGRALRIRET